MGGGISISRKLMKNGNVKVGDKLYVISTYRAYENSQSTGDQKYALTKITVKQLVNGKGSSGKSHISVPILEKIGNLPSITTDFADYGNPPELDSSNFGRCWFKTLEDSLDYFNSL